jgi:hypothetical protein
LFTSILLVVSAGIQAPAATTAPEWKRDYATATSEGKNARKPLAVFVGRGSDGWAQVSDTGRLGPQARELLRDDYVCLYVDRDTPDGQRLATDLALSTEGPGLVITDHSGELQAFRRSGQLSPEDLARWLQTCANPNRRVIRTETGEREDVRYYAPPPPPMGGYYPAFSSGCSS